MERPWLALYDEGIPADLVPEHADALAMFEAAVVRWPDAVALRYFDTIATFAELDAWSTALAAALADRGVGSGDRVAAQLQNVPQLPLTLLAAWKLGAALVPVSPMLREGELEQLLTDSSAAALVALESLWHALGTGAASRTRVATVITTSELDFVDSRPPLLAGARRHRDPATLDLRALLDRYVGQTVSRSQPDPARPAFVTYTSGTTGPSKGTINTHGNVVASSQVYRDWVPLGPDDAILGVAPLFHITGLIGHVTAAFLAGAPLLLAYRFDAPTLLKLAERHRATFTIAAITAYAAMLGVPGGQDLSSLTKLLSGGAPVPPALAAQIEERFGAPLRNVYGLTETTSPSHLVPKGRRAPVDPASGTLSVGVPVSGTFSGIVDAQRRALPPGKIGEIVIAGPQVVSGYWQKPEESQHALPNGLLHTGDVGFMNEEGWFFVVDRLKDQINASGFKVWPREVEDVLLAHPAVLEAAVVGVPDDYRGETVKAYIALRSASKTDVDELIAHCRERLAVYKCPRLVEFVDGLPKTASGKILRRELRERT